jgi:hypothetical protein
LQVESSIYLSKPEHGDSLIDQGIQLPHRECQGLESKEQLPYLQWNTRFQPKTAALPTSPPKHQEAALLLLSIVAMDKDDRICPFQICKSVQTAHSDMGNNEDVENLSYTTNSARKKLHDH